jgi:lipoprotein NlpI
VKWILRSTVVSLVLLTQACTSIQGQGDASTSMGQIVIAEPMSVNYKSEIAVARLTEVIHRAEITEQQRAQLYYDRGVIFDSVGLRSLARLDFSRALRIKPDLVDAHNFLGIHYTQLQKFNQAYESFDSTLDLAPEHEYARLNRGIALYYGGRPELALHDFENFHQLQNDDPYRLLWLYLAQQQIDQVSALQLLRSRAKAVHKNTWAKQIINLYLGDTSQSQFIAELTLGIKSNKELTDRLCEAYFYLGKYNQIKGQPKIAANYFKLALSTNVYEFVEHRYAKLELDLMRGITVGDQTTTP